MTVSEARKKLLIDRLLVVADEEEAAGAKSVAAEFRRQAHLLEKNKDAMLPQEPDPLVAVTNHE